MNEGALHELPEGWVWTKLEDACIDLIGGGTPSRKNPEYFGGNIIWLTPTEIPKNKIEILRDSKEKITDSGLKDSSARIIPKDSVLLTSRASIGYVAIAGCDVTTNQGFASFICSNAIYNFFLAYWLWVNKQLLELNATGTTFKEISKSKLREFYLPLPPLPEQRAIVSKIEQLFSDLDSGINNFKKAQAQLKRYRQSVLKAACDGRLVPTEAELARAEGREYEPADVLLARILKERREKLGKNKKYKEPAEQDTDRLLELPEGWCWANVGMISEKIQYGTSEKAGEDNSGIPVLRMGNIQDGKLIYEDLKYFPKEWSELSDFLLQGGDVLFNRTNSAELVGKTAVYKNQHRRPSVFASYLIRVTVFKDAYIPDMLSYFINSFYGRKYIGSVVSQQVGQANVNGTKLSRMPLPLPPLAEQRRIVAEVERRLSISDKMEVTITESLQKAESLRQSILKKAFEGKLRNEKELEKARNAPDWEPAEKLLERIRQEKQIKENNNKSIRKKIHG